MIIHLCQYSNLGGSQTISIIDSSEHAERLRQIFKLKGTTNSQVPDDYVSNYIKQWNKQKAVDKPTMKENSLFYFYVVYHSMLDLYSGNDYFFGEDDLFKNTKEKECDFPVIHLTTFDVFNPPIGSYKIPNAMRYKSIIDSSIWNYYVPVFGTDKTDKKNTLIERIDFKLFNQSIDWISRNTGNHLYDLAITHEFADLNARLLEQSRLEGTHKSISPFLFHSEQEMKNYLEEYENETTVSLKTIRKYRWRFLLLDDKSIDKMKSADDQLIPICKLEILVNNLRLLGFDEDKIWFRVIDFETLRGENKERVIDERKQSYLTLKNGEELKFVWGRVANGHFDPETNKYTVTDSELPSKPDDIQIVIDCVKYVDAAQYCLQKYKYEVVLLDYLLDRDKVCNEQEYGYQLLKKLNDLYKNHEDEKSTGIDDANPVYVPGPNNRFFFMFTSAFTTAVHERLLAEGFAKSERGLWYIGDGACPTNTPCLFSYQLMLLMRHRIKDIRKSSEGESMSIIDLLKKIYVEKGKAGTEEIRQKAHEHFNHVLFMREKYKRLEKDFSKVDEDWLRHHPNDAEYILNKMKSSLLVQSAFKVVHHFSGAFFEHLQHLVYLTAFGTLRQWQDMWEEYVFVNKELYDYDGFVNEKDENGKERKRGKAISDAIREYIINLKENNY